MDQKNYNKDPTHKANLTKNVFTIRPQKIFQKHVNQKRSNQFYENFVVDRDGDIILERESEIERLRYCTCVCEREGDRGRKK